MRVLFAGEESQTCTIAFRKEGHEAFSCDLKDCSGDHPEWHIKNDMRTAIKNDYWDMVFFFPDCTFITCSAEWAYKEPPYHQKVKPGTLVGHKRILARNDALEFICDILNLCERMNIKRYGFENPVGVIPKRIFRHYDERGRESWKVYPYSLKHYGLKPNQYIQPYQFGDDASKKTGLWLFNLPTLKPTNFIEPKIIGDKRRWANQTDSGQNKLGPSDSRAELRSKTYRGIAAAMASQWTNL